MNKKIIKSELIHKEYTLCTHESGLKILLYPMEGFSSNYAIFGTKYGSLDNSFINEQGEKVDLPEGIAHFLEHKLFESEDGDAFTKYAKTGAYSNAYTSFDRTCYLFSCSNKFYDNLKILLDFVRSPYFTEATVNKEQGIIGQEIRMYDDMPSWRVMFNMLEAMYHNHPVRIDIAGTTDSIAKITHKTLYDCYNRFYDLSNMFIVLAGDFNTDEVLSFIYDNLKVPDKSAADTSSVIPDEPKEVKKHFVSTKLDVATPLFCLGFKEYESAETPNEMQLVSMEILLKMLAGTASPLYKQLLEKGLINEEFSFEYFTGRGFALPMFDGESSHPEGVMEMILNEAKRYREEGLDAKLFEAVRREIYGRSIRRFDVSESVCSMLTDATVLGYDLFEYFNCLANVTLEDVAKRLSVFTEEKAVLSVIEPINSKGEN
ncbi:MAG: pitrilysin family protein [Acutalibacteraceae bacterium]|nr:pitrilysin family protein [Acutalibacteraceae bacterium]